MLLVFYLGFCVFLVYMRFVVNLLCVFVCLFVCLCVCFFVCLFWVLVIVVCLLHGYLTSWQRVKSVSGTDQLRQFNVLPQ